MIMKRIMTAILSTALMLCMVLPAFAATEDVTVNYSVHSGGEHEITVRPNDTITVTYCLSSDTKATSTATTQSEIYFDDTFFSIVPGSNKIDTDSVGEDVFTTSVQTKNSGKSYVYFNSGAFNMMKANEVYTVGSFQLTVIAKSGSSTIENTSYFATDTATKCFKATKENLKVTIAGTKEVSVTGVFLNQTTMTLNSGTTSALTATVQPEDAANRNVMWSSSNTSVAAIDGNGVVTARAAGTATITATTVDGGKTAACTVTVTAQEAETPADDTETDTPTENTDTEAVDTDTETTDTEDTGTDETPAGSASFVDVKKGAYYYNAVLWAADKGITGGTDATHFNPNGTTTRAQMVTFLWRAAGCPEPESGSCAFTDVKANAYYYKAVLWAAEQGITTGVTETTFVPDKTVTRAQAVTYLWRYAKGGSAKSDNPFADVASGAYYYDAVLWAKAEGVTGGVDAAHFAPNKGCTRGQIVTFLYRSVQ